MGKQSTIKSAQRLDKLGTLTISCASVVANSYGRRHSTNVKVKLTVRKTTRTNMDPDVKRVRKSSLIRVLWMENEYGIWSISNATNANNRLAKLVSMTTRRTSIVPNVIRTYFYLSASFARYMSTES